MDDRISRRSFIRYGAAGLGAAAALLPLIGRQAEAAATSEPGAVDRPERVHDDARLRSGSVESDAADAAFAKLVAPIAVGTQLGATCVRSIQVDERGIGVVSIADGVGREWNAEVCRRAADDAELRPLAVSARYALYLRNSGSGSSPTDEPVGKAVLAIGDCIRRNEADVEAPALRSRKEHWQATGYRG